MSTNQEMYLRIQRLIDEKGLSTADACTKVGRSVAWFYQQRNAYVPRAAQVKTPTEVVITTIKMGGNREITFQTNSVQEIADLIRWLK